jgi:hypothetical protein
MSLNLPTHYVQQYANNIGLLLQQKGSKLRPYVMSGSHVGKQASVIDQFGAISMQPVTSRYSAIGRTDASTDRRWVRPSDFELNQIIDSFDKLRLLTDPESMYVQNAMYAAGRQMDDLILAAFFGTAYTGEQGATSTTFPSGQQVAVNFGAAANVGLTVAKLREARRVLMSNEVDIDSDSITAIVKAKQYDNLLAEAQVISTDFNDRPVMADGKLVKFLGINIVHCERVPADTSSYDRIPVFAKSGMYLGLWNDMEVDISQRKDLSSLPWQAYLKMSAGATRLEEGKIVEIKCA